MQTKQMHPELKQLLVEAGEIIVKDFNSKSYSIEYKPDGSPVTSTDKQTQEFLIPKLTKLFPEFKIIAEEVPESHQIDANDTHILTLDPLGGTSNFLAGKPKVDIMISLVINHEVAYATTYNPFTQTFDNIVPSEDIGNTKLRTIERKSVTYHKDVEVIDRKAISNSYRPINYLTNGDIHFLVYPKGFIDIWDLAPAHGVLKKAGGNLFTSKGQEYSYHAIENPEDLIAVMNETLLEKVLQSFEVHN